MTLAVASGIRLRGEGGLMLRLVRLIYQDKREILRQLPAEDIDSEFITFDERIFQGGYEVAPDAYVFREIRTRPVQPRGFNLESLPTAVVPEKPSPLSMQSQQAAVLASIAAHAPEGKRLRVSWTSKDGALITDFVSTTKKGYWAVGVELQNLLRENPSAEVHFEWVWK